MTHATKFCPACRQTLPVEEFHRDISRKDGLNCHCKECKALHRRSSYSKNISVRERARLRAVQWRKKHPGYFKKYRANNPEKVQARWAAFSLVHSGKIPRATDCQCVTCGKPAAEYHHHRGYASEHRYDVIPLCLACHRRAHVKYVPQPGEEGGE